VSFQLSTLWAKPPWASPCQVSSHPAEARCDRPEKHDRFDSQNRRLLPRMASGSSCPLSVDSRSVLPRFYWQLRD